MWSFFVFLRISILKLFVTQKISTLFMKRGQMTFFVVFQVNLTLHYATDPKNMKHTSKMDQILFLCVNNNIDTQRVQTTIHKNGGPNPV